LEHLPGNGDWAIWKATLRPWLMLALILISLSFGLDSDQCLIGRQCAQEVAEIVGERMELQAHCVGGERPA
jgi:hypothetical protein